MKRRDFVKRVVQSAAVTSMGIPNLAFSGNQSKRILFVFCDGAWDTSMVFAPELLGNQFVFTDSSDVQSNIGGLNFVDSGNRPEVRNFFERWGERCSIINGLDFETVAHDRAKRILMTGLASGEDDWGAIIGAKSSNFTAPHLLLSGPNYTTQYSNAVLRVGQNGELKRLMEGIEYSDVEPSTEFDSLVSSHLTRQAQQQLGEHSSRDPFLQDYIRSQEKLSMLKGQPITLPEGILFDNNYGSDCNQTFMAQAQVALDFFEQDISRTAIVQADGFCRMRWDSHGDYYEQNWHYDLLFLGLQQLMSELETRTGSNGQPLINDTLVVVCSEMSRHPQLNEMGGKHHWPVGSAMLIGNPNGGRTIGQYTEQVLGDHIDPVSGGLLSSGQKLTPRHLGATILALADIDPIEFAGVTPIQELLE